MLYNQVQFIAYEINTAPAIINVGSNTAPNWKQVYLGIDSYDLEVDIQARIELIKRALNKAVINADGGENVLKIFMLPEFFFRGPKGAYDFDKSINKITVELQKLVRGYGSKDWLFVFGTIVGEYTETVSNPKKKKSEKQMDIENEDEMEIENENQTIIYNYALVQKGGYSDIIYASENAHIIQKEHMSDIDFIISENNAYQNQFVLERVKHLEALDKTKSEIQQKNYDGTSVFEEDGINFGLEVCLDHAKERLKNSHTLVDIQLVTSCGMELQKNALAVKPGGYAFLCDGNGYGGVQIINYEASSAQWKILLNTNPQQLFNQTYIPENVKEEEVEVAPLCVNLQNLSIEVNINLLYAKGPGKVWICPPQPM